MCGGAGGMTQTVQNSLKSSVICRQWQLTVASAMAYSRVECERRSVQSKGGIGGQGSVSTLTGIFLGSITKSTIDSYRNRNLQFCKAPLESQAQGTSLIAFSRALRRIRGVINWGKLRSDFQRASARVETWVWEGTKNHFASVSGNF